MDWQQLSAIEAAFDHSLGKTQLDQLTPSNNAMLPLRQLPKHIGRLPRCNALRL